MRLNSVHFVMSAHFVGLPRSDDPTHPLYHVPRTNSGMADVGGGDILQTTAAFGNNLAGQDPVVAGTIAHEAGHNLELRHAGTSVGQPCKTNYQSAMNYAYQFGLNGPNGLTIDFSGQVLGPLDETSLNDAPLTVLPSGTLRHFPAWYAPLATSFINSGLQVSAVTKHCNGTPKLDSDPETVRIDGISIGAIDWLNDDDITDLQLSQDINFNGDIDTEEDDAPFAGSNDWIPMKEYGLQQVGSRPNMRALSANISLEDLAPTDLGRLEPGRLEPGRLEPGRLEPGRLEPGAAEPGRLEPGRLEPGAPAGDIDLEVAAAANRGPHSLTATLTPKVVTLSWNPPLAVSEARTVRFYIVSRVDGGIPNKTAFNKRNVVGQTTGGVTTPPDTTLPDNKVTAGKTYTYWVQAELDNGDRTGISNFLTVIAQ